MKITLKDGVVKEFYENVRRPEAYKEIKVEEGAYYDSIVKIDLSKMEAMIALPFHPSKYGCYKVPSRMKHC